MKKQIFIFGLIVIITTLYSCKTEEQIRQVGFYNVENLFDTIDGPNDDAEFLPNGKNNWNSIRYEEKLNHINKVFNEWSSPLIIGLCEIENENVVRDILHHSDKLKNYGVVHFESPDARGIDVALIYDSMNLKKIQSGRLRFTLPNMEAPSSRDILWAKFNNGKDTLFAMVNHWPSRRGGEKESEPNRVEAAKTARIFIDSVLNVNQNSKIIFMGDLNDYPTDAAPSMISEKLEPMITKTSGDYGGTHNYNKEWNILDHIMVSNGLFENGKIKVIQNSGKIHSYDFLLEEYKGATVPFRTYAGSKYLGGFSDHLPVSIEISFP